MSAEQTGTAPRIEAAVRAALATIADPCSIATGVPINLLEMGLVDKVTIDEQRVHVALRLTSPICMQVVNIIAAIEEAVLPIAGVCCVEVTADSGINWMPDMMATSARERLRRARPLVYPEPAQSGSAGSAR